MKISAEARTCLAEFLEDAEDSFIRVGQTTVGGGCCSRLILGVSIDLPKRMIAQTFSG